MKIILTLFHNFSSNYFWTEMNNSRTLKWTLRLQHNNNKLCHVEEEDEIMSKTKIHKWKFSLQIYIDDEFSVQQCDICSGKYRLQSLCLIPEMQNSITLCRHYNISKMIKLKKLLIETNFIVIRLEQILKSN